MLVNQLYDGAAWVDSAVRFANTTGTPLVSATPTGDGRDIADVYTLTFSVVTAGVTATVTVQTVSANNPYRTSGSNPAKVVNLDGVTVYTDVIPGVSLVFSNQGTFSAAWVGAVTVGEPQGNFDAFGGGAGVPSAGVRQRVHNTGTGAVQNAKARILPIVKWRKTNGTVFAVVRPFAEGATEKIAGGGSSRVMPYVMSISATAGAGAGKTCTLSVDGAAFGANTLRNLTTNALQDGTGVKATGVDFYRVVSGPLTGLEFAVAATCANGDTANLLIFSPRFIQIAPDVAGAAGAYGVADVVLTEAGQSAGTLTAGGVAYYWVRVLVPAGGSSESNPTVGDVALTGTEGGAAGW